MTSTPLAGTLPVRSVRYVPDVTCGIASALREQGAAGVHGDTTVPVGPTTTGAGQSAPSPEHGQ